MRKSIYTNRPIATVTSLARALSCSPDMLKGLCANVDNHYYPPQPQPKPDGTFRETYQAKDQLDKVHQAILHTILNKVKYANYLQGSIKDQDMPRSYIKDAALHVDSGIVVSIDISNFFPSTTFDIIFNVWKYFFDFPDDVASMLARLTTLQGFLPQGARTSSCLANLVFFDKEPALEERLRKRGLRYTRYVDDITVSANRYLKSEELEYVFRQVIGMFRSKDLSPNRQKIATVTKGNPLQIHNLNINSGRPTLPSEERSRIRAAVKECELDAERDPVSEEYAKLWQRTLGRVQMMHTMHHNEADKYLDRLDAVKPE